jgi:hypothetical protein
MARMLCSGNPVDRVSPVGCRSTAQTRSIPPVLADTLASATSTPKTGTEACSSCCTISTSTCCIFRMEGNTRGRCDKPIYIQTFLELLFYLLSISLTRPPSAWMQLLQALSELFSKRAQGHEFFSLAD